MQTVYTTSPEEAAEFIKRGGVAAFPTETVYGLGANVFDASAIAKIFEAKKRPGDNPLIAHVSDVRQISDLAAEITDSAVKLIDAFFPGPLTIVLKKLTRVPEVATSGLDTIGIRMPRFELAHRFLEACKTPVVAPSANLSGRPSPTTWQAVAEDLDSRIDCVLQGIATEIGIESTVVDCTSPIPLVLRSGSVTIDQLCLIIPEITFSTTPQTEAPRSPGLRHRHYSPKARVVIASDIAQPVGTLSDAFIGINRPLTDLKHERICSTVEEYAHSIFEFFRECDRADVQTIFCEEVEEKGIGVALMDRIRRAAEAGSV